METAATAYNNQSVLRRGKGVSFYRIRRVTGYLSELKHWNNGKRAEERDRLIHNIK